MLTKGENEMLTRLRSAMISLLITICETQLNFKFLTLRTIAKIESHKQYYNGFLQTEYYKKLRLEDVLLALSHFWRNLEVVVLLIRGYLRPPPIKIQQPNPIGLISFYKPKCWPVKYLLHLFVTPLYLLPFFIGLYKNPFDGDKKAFPRYHNIKFFQVKIHTTISIPDLYHRVYQVPGWTIASRVYIIYTNTEDRCGCVFANRQFT